jgi:hypothetical protein
MSQPGSPVAVAATRERCRFRMGGMPPQVRSVQVEEAPDSTATRSVRIRAAVRAFGGASGRSLTAAARVSLTVAILPFVAGNFGRNDQPNGSWSMGFAAFPGSSLERREKGVR